MPVETEWKEIEEKIEDFKAQVQTIKLENPETITLSRTDKEVTGLVTLEEVKHAYWNRCIAGTDPVTGAPYKRFVARSEFMAESRGNTHQSMPIWEPKSPDDDFNLVLSLCTDGMHRPLVDVDEFTYEYSTKERLPGTKMFARSVVPSTSHWHVYHHYGVDFNRQLKLLDSNASYKDNVQRAGFASLRPPWVSKGWMEPSFYRSEYHGFEESDWLPPVPKDDGKIGWEDLFNEG